MKKLVLLCAAVMLVSALASGCSSTSGSRTSWCRSGSLFPIARNTQANETVYLSAAATSASQCDPCSPNQCQPCEPACNPCEPICNPCDNNTRVRGSFVPGPAN